MKIKDLANYEDIEKELADMVRQFEIDCNRYQTDVYLYIDEDGTGRLDTFVNVSGTSWLDDDHIKIYADKQRNYGPLDQYDNNDLCDVIGKSMEEVANEIGVDMDDFDRWEFEHYIKEHYWDVFIADYVDFVDHSLDFVGLDFVGMAREIIEQFDRYNEF